jgi:hypothetical protein
MISTVSQPCPTEHVGRRGVHDGSSGRACGYRVVAASRRLHFICSSACRSYADCHGRIFYLPAMRALTS